jgi:simple sugar transport system permease protein
MTINNNNTAREPLIRISKRDDLPWWRSWGVRLLSIVFALILCAVVIVLLTGHNPLKVYVDLFNGTFGSKRKVWNTFQDVAMLLAISLAVTPAFKMKFWNIGAEGQVLVGCLASAASMIYFGNKLPYNLVIPIAVFSSTTAGAIWAAIPAVFKAKWNTNETLFTLMMNYVAIQIVSYCIVFWENPKGSNTVGIINGSTQGGWIHPLFGQKYLLNIIVVAVMTIFMYFYLNKRKHGYEITVVGESVNTARYIGINVPIVIIRTMLISGALCGLTGFLLVSGTHHTITVDTVGGMGFTAIMVSWLAKFNPLTMTLTSFLIEFLEHGAGEIVTASNGRLDSSISAILTGIILFFIIGSEFFVRYKLNFRGRHKETKVAEGAK